MSNNTIGVLASSLLVALGGVVAVPSLPPESPPISQLEPSLSIEPTFVPQIDDLTSIPPGRVGLVRDGDGSRVVPFMRIQGHANSCRCTVSNSPVGSRWLGIDERIYEKLADGSFWQMPTANERSAGAVATRPVGTWGSANTGFT